MIGSKTESSTSTGSGQTGDLRKALDFQILQKMLRGTAGAFSFRYWFINEYINYINLLNSNPSIKPETVSKNKGIDAKNIYNNLKSVIYIIKLISFKEQRIPVDVLFISRNRIVKVKTKTGYAEGDYVFYSVLENLKKVYQDIGFSVYLIDDTYQKYEYARPLDLLRSTFWALEKCIRWRLHRKDIDKFFERQGCSYAARSVRTFFSLRPLLRNALLGYSISNMFSIYKPKVIVANDDCMYTKPPDDNAKLIYKRFIVLQSARMAEYGEELRSYIFQEPELRPDCFLASGKAFGEMKKKWRIADSIVVTGLPRYDILGGAGEVYSKSDFLKRYSINPNHRIIHWSTQCHVFSHEENEANFEAVFGAIKKLKDVTLVIKQHPSESEKFSEEIERRIRDCKANAILTPKDSDTYEQLFVCDLMITRHSTTAMEAVALNKPVIILNLSGEPDQVEYVQEGVALGVYREIDLLAALERLLCDDSALAVRRQQYIEKYLYKIDGKATERVVDVIINSLSKF